ncbi:hypothetical protein HDU79_011528 [Rhizoclosmatium sp. JEL0117]|nr:hypothetical protein HDU79_011528 [Rhizoclosmatium sp. JEL0117]
MGLIMDSTDAALYTVFKNSAATEEDIVKGLAALEKYSLDYPPTALAAKFMAEILTGFSDATDELASRSCQNHADLFDTGPGRAFAAKDVSKDQEIAVLKALITACPPHRNTHSANGSPRIPDPLKLFVVGFPAGTTTQVILGHFKGAINVNLARTASGKPIAFVSYVTAAAATAGFQ